MQHRFHQFVLGADTTKDRVVIILDNGAETYFLLDDVAVIDSIAYLLQKPALFFLLPAHSFAVVDVFKKTGEGCKKCCESDGEEMPEESSKTVEPKFVFNYEVFNSFSLFEPHQRIKALVKSGKQDAESELTLSIKFAIAPGKCPVPDCPTTIHHSPCYFPQKGVCDDDGKTPGCVAGGGG